MIIAHTFEELHKSRHGSIGLVPTMGALHEGHLSLIRRARAECETVVVSLFVNPAQFGPNEDFTAYPRNEIRDCQVAQEAGADLLFAPSVEAMYPDMQTFIQVGKIGERWEGEHRPGHFQGVATVVAKLFNLVDPAVSYFGLKDYQQCRVIDALVRDLNFPIKLVFGETVREPDGLALSSRNAYLSPEKRQAAPELYATLSHTALALRAGGSPPQLLQEGKTRLASVGFEVQYLAWVDANDLEPTEDLSKPSMLICAAKLGTTRLIDNVSV